MKVYVVIGALAQVGFGEMIALSPEQFRSRSHTMTRHGEADAKEVAILTTPTSVQTFKRGEVLGLSDVPKSQAAALAEFTPEKKDKKGAAFVDAVAAMAAAREEAELTAQLEREQKESEQRVNEARAKAVTEYEGSTELKARFKTADAYLASLRAA